MGSCNIEFTMKNGSFSDVRKKFRSEQEDCEYNDGYSGEINTIDGVTDKLHKIFPDINSAQEWTLENCEKREMLAVRYVSIESTKSKKMKDKIDGLEEKLRKAEKEVTNLREKFNADIKNALSSTISCKKCESKINRSYVNNGACLVCGNLLYSPTMKNRLNAKIEKISEAKERLKKYRADIKNKVDNGSAEKNQNLEILVSGWAAS